VDKDGASWDNANPANAYHNPADTSKGNRDLTSDNTQYACWINKEASQGSTWNFCTNGSISFYPATYFQYKGSGSVYDASSYTRVEIKSANAPFSGGTNRTDCANPNACTYAEEIQNFANWYTYHRSRILTARAGIGRAFAAQGTDIRVGNGAIKEGSRTLDGKKSPRTILRGVRSFSGDDREEFFDLLYNYPIEEAATPLRRGLDDAGQYYCRDDDEGPWSTTPGESGGTDLSCRSSYTILMTDGYWNSGDSNAARGGSSWSSPRRANVDGKNGPVISNPVVGSSSYQYKPQWPYQDIYSDTLADVAMYYWNHDLRTDIANQVPTSAVDEAFWQHMVTFGVGFGVNGTLNPSSDLSSLEDGSKSWPNPVTDDSDPAKIDDLWHASLNSRGDFFSAGDPDEFAQKMTDMVTSLVERRIGSATAIATNSTRLVGSALIYQARFDSSDWSGEVIAYSINSDGSVGDAAWDTDDSGKIPDDTDRKIFSWDGSSGVEFKWDNLTSSQKAFLQSDGTEQQGKDRLNWVRGDQSKEKNQTDGYLRSRTRILGDIVNSNPVVVGASDFGYDQLQTTISGQSTYNSFQTSNKLRRKILYIGGNDGMLHAFDISTGEERFAYVPSATFENLADLTQPDYVHRYFVDGSPYYGDAYDPNSLSWKTVLVGSLGAGGRSVFALDITDPDNFNASKVLWEFTDTDMGYVMGPPVIARMQNGEWAAIFGNGYESDNHRAFLYIVNLWTGALIKKIDTGAGTVDSPNGLAAPALLPDEYKTVNYVYAGDLLGNLWKIDLTNQSATKWAIAYSNKVQGKIIPLPLFRARNASDQVQPITAPLEIGKHPTSGYLIYFGTGKYFETEDNVVGNSPSIQSFYGIWDDGTAITETDRSKLLQQQIIYEGKLSAASSNQYRITSANTINWTSQQGWYMDLVPPSGTADGERVVTTPLLRHNRVIFTTMIPSDDPCASGGASWLMELDALTGSRLEYAPFDTNGDGEIDSNDLLTVTDADGNTTQVAATGVYIYGITQLGGIITDGDKEYKYLSDSRGNITAIPERTNDNDLSGRRSWRQLR
jgi:type IV pilus assembly protein PilY1